MGLLRVMLVTVEAACDRFLLEYFSFKFSGILVQCFAWWRSAGVPAARDALPYGYLFVRQTRSPGG